MEQNAGNTEQQTPGAPVQSFGKDSYTLGMLCHLLGIFTWFLGALIIWLIKKDEDSFVDDQGKEALNFQITLIIAYAAGAITSCIGIGVLIIIAAEILNIVFCIMGAVAASKGTKYRYPICIRLVK